MDKESFSLNCGLLPPLIFEQPPLLEAIMPPSQPLSTEISSPPSNFLTETAIGSLATSPLVSESFMITELYGKLGDVSPPEMRGAVTPVMGSCNTSPTNSCYATPPSSPHSIGIHIMDHLVKGHFSRLGNSIPFTPTLPTMPGFTDRAARFSSFGTRSLNVLTGQFRLDKSSQLPYGRGTLTKVSSSPSSLKAAGSRIGNQLSNGYAQHQENHMRVPAAIDEKWSKLAANCAPGQSELANNSTANSSRVPSNEDGYKHRTHANSRKRKATPRGKVNQVSAAEPFSSSKKVTADGDDDDQRAKRTKMNEGNREQRGMGNAEKDKDDDSKKHSDGNKKPCEPPKDYIHVRARRGQATDSHSLAERVRREKISERMRLLQDLVPGCKKVTGKALMLDEIINYVQSLQKQVEFLSMKLAAVNPRMKFNLDTLFTNKLPQPSSSFPRQIHHLVSPSTEVYCGQQSLPNSLQANTTNSIVTPSSMDPFQASDLNHDNGLKLSLTDGLNGDVSQLPPLFQDDLQAIVDAYGFCLK